MVGRMTDGHREVFEIIVPLGGLSQLTKADSQG